MSVVVGKIDRNDGSALKTSPNMKKSSLPTVVVVWSRMRGTHSCQNSMLTCLTVSMRKPSTPYSEVQNSKMSTMPSTTSGCSVNRSSSPKKSPYTEFSPEKLELPRLWYSVGSFSQAGTFTVSSAGVSKVGV